MGQYISGYLALVAHHTEHHAELDALRAQLEKAKAALGKLADQKLYEFDYENDDYIFRDGAYGGTTPWEFAVRALAELEADDDRTQD